MKSYSFTHTLGQIAFSFVALSCFSLFLYAGEKNIDSNLLKEFITSKGYSDSIVFDSSNIKQFWIDNSVFTKDNNIFIKLQNQNNALKSLPFKIQLANVNETLDCKIDIVTTLFPAEFSIENSYSKTISFSSEDTSFINYKISSALFHLEDTPDNSFYIRFTSDNESLQILKIVLSFSKNKKSIFLASPGLLKTSKDNCVFSSCVVDTTDLFSVTGKMSSVMTKNKILLSDSPVSSYVSIQNTGKTQTRVYFGYALYTKDGKKLDHSNFPYNLRDERVLNILSSKKGSNTIIVDSLPKWEKNCKLASNAKDDYSDIPSQSFIPGQIVEIKELPNNQAEIIMSKPLDYPIENDVKVRINGLSGGYLYTKVKVLKPGEELSFESSIQKDNNSLQFTTKAFPKGVYYIRPVILSFSLDSTEDNVITIKECTISY